MTELLRELVTFKWWIGVVVVSVVLNVASAYLKNSIDRWKSAASGRWRAASSKRLAEREQRVASLRDNDAVRLLVALSSIDSRVFAVKMLVAAALFFTCGATTVVMNTLRPEAGGLLSWRAFGNFSFTLSIVALLVFLASNRDATERWSLVREAVLTEQLDAVTRKLLD